MLDVRERLAADDLPERLTLLGFRGDDRTDALAAAAAVLERPAEVAAVQTMAERLVPAIGVIGDPWDGSLPWPWRAEGTDSAYGAGVLELLALVATVDEVRAYHASRGIGGDDSWRALSDLGQQVFVHRLTYGAFGLHTHDWLRVAWSGALYWLGRLQFNLQRDPLDPGAEAAGTWVLSTHIPRSGPLTPAEVDASFAAARTFFAEHFADFAVDRLPLPQLAAGSAAGRGAAGDLQHGAVPATVDLGGRARERGRGRRLLHLRPAPAGGPGGAASRHDAAAGDPRSARRRRALARPKRPHPVRRPVHRAG